MRERMGVGSTAGGVKPSGPRKNNRKRPRPTSFCNWGVFGLAAVCTIAAAKRTATATHAHWSTRTTIARHGVRALRSLATSSSAGLTATASATASASISVSSSTSTEVEDDSHVGATSSTSATFTSSSAVDDGGEGDDNAGGASSTTSSDDGGTAQGGEATSDTSSGTASGDDGDDGDDDDDDDDDVGSRNDDNGDTVPTDGYSSASSTTTSAPTSSPTVSESDDQDNGDSGEGSSTQSPGSDSSDHHGDDDSTEPESYIEVSTPNEGDVIDSNGEYTVAWKYVSDESEEIEMFHIDLYNCGSDEECGGDCGEFYSALCEEEGCHSTTGTEPIRFPVVEQESGPYYKIAVSADGTDDMGCSGPFELTGSSDPSDDGYTGDYSSSLATVTSDDDNHDGDDDAVNSSAVAITDCEDLSLIAGPLQGNLEVTIGVEELSCDETTTVHVSGGTLTISSDLEVVFHGVRFEIDTDSSLVLTSAATTIFSDVIDMQINGGILSVAEGGTVDIAGSVTFKDNSVQGTVDMPNSGGAIYNQGIIHLRGGAEFSNNKCGVSTEDGLRRGAGDGGAIWNGASGTIRISGAAFKGNEAGLGGRGGAVWNSNVVMFDDDTWFVQNEVHYEEDSDDDGGQGGGVFNDGGKIRFYGTVEFSDNEAKAGSAIVNAGGGKMVMHQSDTIIQDNESQDVKGGDAGAVWNQEDSVLWFRGSVSWLRNRSYNAAAMLNYGKVVFLDALSVEDNEASMDGGGFINESGSEVVFYSDVEFIANIGTGYGGAILNRASLEFRGDEGTSIVFIDNYCGEQECQDIQNKDGSDVRGLDSVPDMCDIGTHEL